MASQYSDDGSRTSNTSGEGSEATVELNIKTLDSEIFSLQVDKNMPVSAFKEKIANEIGLPVGQQRLIFRGKVLKDEHRLSEYQVENGHTLHLVARQPTQPQPSGDATSSTTNANNGNRGNDVTSGTPPSRVGQISHSVVLGTFNVGDQGEGVVPDLSRVIGAVLNSFGIGGQATNNGASGMQSSTMPNVGSQSQTSQGNETAGGSQSNTEGQSQAGNQNQSGQAFPGQPFQSPPQVMQIPLSAAVPLPSLHSPLPDSLSTLQEFMMRMEQALAQNGYQSNTSSNSTVDLPRLDLPSNAQGLQALGIVLRHAERLLSGHTITALSHIAGRLEQEGASSDPSVRGQIQAESVHVGLAMQHLGALLLELGRTILTLRMGQSLADSSVSPGPAVYISPSGPNPIMVQPFPLQTNSLFGGSALQSNSMTVGPAGISSAPRNINIHIHAGTSLAPVISTLGSRATNGEGQGEQGTGSGPVRVLPVRNVIAATVPSRPGVNVSNVAQPGLDVSISQPPSDSTSLSSLLAEANSRLRGLVGSMQGENQPISGHQARNEHPSSMVASGAGESTATLPGLISEGDDQKNQDDNVQEHTDEAKKSLLSSTDVSSFSMGCSSGETSLTSEGTSKLSSSPSEKYDLPEGAQAVPLGLGLGGLELKRRSRQPKPLAQKPLAQNGDNGASNIPVSQNVNAGTSGQQLLLSLASRTSGANRASVNEMHSGQIPMSVDRNPESRPAPRSSNAQLDVASVMSQVMQNPALNGNTLGGVSEQTGAGSPNVLRNMLQQLTQNPQIMSTVSQIAQQVDGQDIGDMFSGLGSGQGGGIDISRMVQQMMPVVSQVLGHGSNSQPFSSVGPESQQFNGSRPSGNERPNNQNVQIDLQEVAQRIEHFNPPGDIFRAVAESAERLNGSESRSQNIVYQLSNNEDLVSDYIEMLRRDIHHWIQGDPGQD